MSNKAQPTIQQYEELRIPKSWDTDEKKLIMQLTEVLDDIYRRFGRLRFQDMGKALRERMEDTEGNVSELNQTAKSIELRVTALDGSVASLEINTAGLVAAVKNNRLAFSEYGLTIINAQGDIVFSQDNSTGNLEISGIIKALGGIIGGFTIGQSSLFNGDRIILDASGLIKLGDLVITDSANFGPILEAGAGITLRVGGTSYLYIGNNGLTANKPLYAQYGFFINPSRTTTNAPNLWANTFTGEVFISTNTSGGGNGGGTDPTPEPLQAYAHTAPSYITAGTPFYINAGATGGTGDYVRYRFLGPSGNVFSDGATNAIGPFVDDAGTRSWTITVWDSAGASSARVLEVVVH